MNRPDVETGFAEDYSSARAQFLGACDARALPVASYRHPADGPDGDELFTDTVRIGNRDARKVLLINSGTHGVEGYAGSNAQVDLLRTLDAARLPADTAVALIHLINPWGTAWRRRHNEDNIDLNRHFIDRSRTSPSNGPHDRLIAAGFLHALSASTPAEALSLLAAFRNAWGDDSYAQAVFQGQYDCPKGLGFGGVVPCWSHRTLEAALQDLLSGPAYLALIDLHTGLGPFGTGTLICTEPPCSEETLFLRKWYDARFVAILEDRKGLPYALQGDLAHGVRRIFPGARVLPISLEFGTYEAGRFAELMIQDAWAEMRSDLEHPEVEAIRCDIMHFFYPRSRAWRRMVASRTSVVTAMALAGLKAL